MNDFKVRISSATTTIPLGMCPVPFISGAPLSSIRILVRVPAETLKMMEPHI